MKTRLSYLLVAALLTAIAQPQSPLGDLIKKVEGQQKGSNLSTDKIIAGL